MAGKPPEPSRDRILEISERLFTEHGYRGVSIREISQACKLTNAALYYHFSNKEALYAAVLEQYTNKLNIQMQQAASGGQSRREQLVAMLLEYVRLSADRRSPFLLLHHAREGLHPERYDGERKKYFQGILNPIQHVIDSAKQEQEIRLPAGEISPAALLLGMTHAHLQQKRILSNSEITPTEIRGIVDLFWFGVARNPDPQPQENQKSTGGIR